MEEANSENPNSKRLVLAVQVVAMCSSCLVMIPTLPRVTLGLTQVEEPDFDI